MDLLTTEEFAGWFAGLDDAAAEDVATMVELVHQLGVERAAPRSREALLWYENRRTTLFDDPSSPWCALSWELEAWGQFRDYARRVLRELEAPRFAARLGRIPAEAARKVLRCVEGIRRFVDPSVSWALRLRGTGACRTARSSEDALGEVRRLYFGALEAAGFVARDVPAHSLALREVARRVPAPAFRILYGVDAERDRALVVSGEWLDRSFYGDSVRRAERLWSQFLGGELRAEPAPLR